ncbi:hypothetical protein [uncultured Psychroserpens sp.]|uniref:hypothetical protein n=1 Tax=uncultured Psychroserpens sp. TaxID=255436 RepID=UPI00261A3E37|nr:hypothetical protein [uncultured Psychroserpens sp.]
MKKSIKLVTCLFLLLSLTIHAQQNSQHIQQCDAVTLNRNIQLDGSSDTEEIKIEVASNAKKLHIGINSTIKSGYLTVEVYDPKGNKKGNFSIESQVKSSSKKKELVCGQMQKHIDEPIKGDWVIKLIPNNVAGDISICTSMM